MKIKIFSVHAGRTDFLRLQYESLVHFLEDSFEYYCIDNFIHSNESSFIEKECKNLNINYVRFKTYSLSGTAHDHAPALNSIKTISSNEDINVILDFDVFLINKFSILNYIKNFDIAGIYQQRNEFLLEYLAPIFVIVNSNKNFNSIDFDSRKDILSDVGSNTSLYLKDKNIKLMKHTSALIGEENVNCFNINYNTSFSCQIIENSFLHYYKGTNWNNNDPQFVHEKTEWLKFVIKESKKYNILNLDYLQKYQTPFSHSFRYWNGSPEPFKSILNPYYEN